MAFEQKMILLKIYIFINFIFIKIFSDFFLLKNKYYIILND